MRSREMNQKSSPPTRMQNRAKAKRKRMSKGFPAQIHSPAGTALKSSLTRISKTTEDHRTNQILDTGAGRALVLPSRFQRLHAQRMSRGMRLLVAIARDVRRRVR
jgi:ribosomal protein RSM22 (predicted rRNA methylase)